MINWVCTVCPIPVRILQIPRHLIFTKALWKVGSRQIFIIRMNKWGSMLIIKWPKRMQTLNSVLKCWDCRRFFSFINLILLIGCVHASRVCVRTHVSVWPNSFKTSEQAATENRWIGSGKRGGTIKYRQAETRLHLWTVCAGGDRRQAEQLRTPPTETIPFGEATPLPHADA